MSSKSNNDVTVIYEVRCWSRGKIVRRVHFWIYEQLEHWCEVNRKNYDELVVHYIFP